MHDNPGVNFRRKCPRVGVFLCVFGAGDAYEVGDVGAGDADDVIAMQIHLCTDR